MISPKNDDSMNSTFGYRDGVDRQTALLHIAAPDAAQRGIGNDDQVRMWNDRGSCVMVARVVKACVRA
ncbi:MAG: molybdopterin dinucleotide binding domain-containing protein [Ignavibacteriota bacterium]